MHIESSNSDCLIQFYSKKKCRSGTQIEEHAIIVCNHSIAIQLIAIYEKNVVKLKMHMHHHVSESFVFFFLSFILNRKFVFSAHECGQCGKKFGRKSHLKVHINTVHKKKYVPCPNCHNQMHPNSLQRHMRNNCVNSKKCTYLV